MVGAGSGEQRIREQHDATQGEIREGFAHIVRSNEFIFVSVFFPSLLQWRRGRSVRGGGGGVGYRVYTGLLQPLDTFDLLVARCQLSRCPAHCSRRACVDCVGCRLNSAYNENFHSFPALLPLATPLCHFPACCCGCKAAVGNLH